MTGYCVSDIAAITGGVLSGDGTAPVTGAVIDSRAVTPGALFAAIPGERVDGHDYIGKAFDLGASCCLAQRVPAGETRPVICVPDTAAALEVLARAYRARFAIPVLGVTGSVGKTTAKEMVASVLAQRWNTLKTEKNFNNQLGVPLTLFRLEPEHQAAVVEMGVSHFGDMAPLAAMVQPTAMLFTIIGHAHLEFLRDRRGVLQEKTSVLDTMPDDAVAFCNGDDDLLRAMTCRQRKVTFGLSDGCDVRAVDVRDLGDGGSTCTIVAGARRIPVHIRAYGQHMVYAALEGAAVGIEYGLTDDEIIRGIAAYQPVGSRANVVRTALLQRQPGLHGRRAALHGDAPGRPPGGHPRQHGRAWTQCRGAAPRDRRLRGQGGRVARHHVRSAGARDRGRCCRGGPERADGVVCRARRAARGAAGAGAVGRLRACQGVAQHGV